MRSFARGEGRPAAWKTMAALIAVGFGLALVGTGVVVMTESGYIRPAVDISLADTEATYDACQNFVRAEVKGFGPLTFAPIRSRTVRRYADGRVYVRSHADAPNAAGRVVEIRFACKLRPLGAARWDLEGLSVSTD